MKMSNVHELNKFVTLDLPFGQSDGINFIRLTKSLKTGRLRFYMYARPFQVKLDEELVEFLGFKLRTMVKNINQRRDMIHTKLFKRENFSVFVRMQRLISPIYGYDDMRIELTQRKKNCNAKFNLKFDFASAHKAADQLDLVSLLELFIMVPDTFRKHELIVRAVIHWEAAKFAKLKQKLQDPGVTALQLFKREIGLNHTLRPSSKTTIGIKLSSADYKKVENALHAHISLGKKEAIFQIVANPVALISVLEKVFAFLEESEWLQMHHKSLFNIDFLCYCLYYSFTCDFNHDCDECCEFTTAYAFEFVKQLLYRDL